MNDARIRELFDRALRLRGKTRLHRCSCFERIVSEYEHGDLSPDEEVLADRGRALLAWYASKS